MKTIRILEKTRSNICICVKQIILRIISEKIMKSNRVKTRILPILDEIIAYLQNKSFILNKVSREKFPLFNNQWQKKMRNLKIFGEIIPYSRKQLQKISQGKKRKRFGKIGAYLRSQFKRKSRISNNQP